MKTFKVLVFTLCTAFSINAVEPLYDSPMPSGAISVALHPTEVVQNSNPVTITFGVPFARGSITATDLATVRVLKGGQEIAAHVEMLTPWRHVSDAGLDNASVRVALVQINFPFTARFPAADTVTVEWGRSKRSKDIISKSAIRTSWHLVTSGTFAAADSVWEPDAFAVLPRELLCDGILRFPRMEPFPDTFSIERDDPAKMAKVLHWPGNMEQMRAQKNFFYSIINRDDTRDTAICHYTTDCEPWLFDRSSSMYVLYFRSSMFLALREAVRACEFYARHLTKSGFFDLKAGDDAKYSYNECLAYTYWLTGDTVAAQKIPLVTTAFSGVRTRWTPTMNFWTERHCGFKLMANTIAYEVAGGAFLDTMLAIRDDFLWMQNGAGGQLPASRIDGGLYHYGSQHDWDWAEDTLGASPWMSVFVLDPLMRVYACSQDTVTGSMIKRMAKFMTAACIQTGHKSADGVTMLYPRYAMLFDGRDGQADEWTDPQHSLEVGASIANGYYVSLLLGKPDTTLRHAASALYATYDDGVNDWIRPDGPASFMTAYRVSPWRKYNWEYRPSGGFSWAINQSGTSVNVKTPSTVVQHAPIMVARMDANGIVINLHLEQPAGICAELFGFDGKRIALVRTGTLQKGGNRVLLPYNNLSARGYIVKVTAQGKKFTQMVFGGVKE